MSLKFGTIRPWTAELAVLERLRKKNGGNLVSTLEPSFLIGSFSFLQVMRTIIKTWTSLNFGGIPLPTSELTAFKRLKNLTIRVLVLECLHF